MLRRAQLLCTLPLTVHARPRLRSWAFALFGITDSVITLYDDDVLGAQLYPSLRWLADRWLSFAPAPNYSFSYAYYGDVSLDPSLAAPPARLPLCSAQPHRTLRRPPETLPAQWMSELAPYPASRGCPSSNRDRAAACTRPHTPRPTHALNPLPFPRRIRILTVVPEYGSFFLARALDIVAPLAARLGLAADATRFAAAGAAVRAAYLARNYDAAAGLFGNASAFSLFSNLLGLTLRLLPEGSAQERAVFDKVLTSVSGPAAPYPGRFGGGIFSLKMLFPLLDRFGGQAAGLAALLATRRPALGAWIADGETTLLEGYDLNSTDPANGGSYNHAMFAGFAPWLFRSLAGLGRAEGSRGWARLELRPPGPASGLAPNMLTWASAAVDTPAGPAASAWAMTPTGAAAAAAASAAASAVAAAAAALDGGGSGGGVGGGTLLYSYNCSVPVGATAVLALPAVAAAGSVVVQEGSAVVFQNNTFVPGVAGIAGAQASADGAAVDIVLGSGDYVFEVQAA